MKRFKRIAVVLATVLVVSTVGVWIWASRGAQPAASLPGYVWLATVDGTTTNAAARVQSALSRYGIASCYDSMMVADIYVQTDKVARARLVLALHSLTCKDWIRIH